MQETAYAAAVTWDCIFPEKPLDRTSLYAAITQTISSSTCVMDGHPFQVVIKSFSGEPEEDDMTVWFLSPGASPTFADLGGQTRMYSFTSPEKGLGSLCSIDAFSDGLGHAVIPLHANDRPFGDEMAAVFYNPKSRRVLASAEGIGEVPETSLLERTPSGFAFEEDLQPSDSAACSTKNGDPCGTWQGHRILEMTDESIPVWWDVSLSTANALAVAIDLLRTWTHSPIANYFKSMGEYDQTFSLDSSKSKSQIVYWFKQITLDNKERWVCAAPDRDLPASAALCRLESRHSA